MGPGKVTCSVYPLKQPDPKFKCYMIEGTLKLNRKSITLMTDAKMSGDVTGKIVLIEKVILPFITVQIPRKEIQCCHIFIS